MSQGKLTLGQAIDQLVAALEALDEGARRTAVETACAHLKISVSSGGNRTQERARDADPQLTPEDVSRESPAAPASKPYQDIRSLRTEKKPRSAKQMACVVAFYLQEMAPEGEHKESITAADLEKYFKQANFKLPAKIQQVLPDAKRSGYFDTVGTGSYKLNAVGYNLVAHKLPPGPTDS